MRVSGFDLGTSGAVYRASMDDGTIRPLSCERWSWTGQSDEQRYAQYSAIARAELAWADAVGYEQVQFNRGKSLIEGFRGILLAQAEEADIFCSGVNVSTLKKFAINGRWSDADRKEQGKDKIDGKKKMSLALAMDHPEFHEFMDGTDDVRTVPVQGKRDDLIDAAWVCIWLLKVAEISP